MKFIIFTKEQAELIKGKYGKFSGLDPIKVFRNKYLLGQKVPYTEVEEYALSLNVLDSEDLKSIKGFLSCFPVYDADYYIKEQDTETNEERIIYLDQK